MLSSLAYSQAGSTNVRFCAIPQNRSSCILPQTVEGLCQSKSSLARFPLGCTKRNEGHQKRLVYYYQSGCRPTSLSATESSIAYNTVSCDSGSVSQDHCSQTPSVSAELTPPQDAQEEAAQTSNCVLGLRPGKGTCCETGHPLVATHQHPTRLRLHPPRMGTVSCGGFS